MNLLKRIKEFVLCPKKEKTRNLYSRKRNLIYKWETQAKKKLIDIIKQNADKMNGFEFEASCSGYSFTYTSGINVYTVRTQKNQLILETRDYDCRDDPYKQIISPEELAEKIIECPNDYNSYLYGKYNNNRRNKILAEIFKRTGRNLKSEVRINRD